MVCFVRSRWCGHVYFGLGSEDSLLSLLRCVKWGAAKRIERIRFPEEH